jgi:GTPase SAR1 family protein
MSAPRLKVLLVGPSKAGKTSLSSFLAGIQDSVSPAAPPMPTIGVRVLEVERFGVSVELWDVSGDQQYESTWPAVQEGVGGAFGRCVRATRFLGICCTYLTTSPILLP